MIVLSRKLRDYGTPDGRIYVGDDVVIHVHSTKEGQVRIGVSAPRDVKIFRQELLPLEQQKAREPHHDLGGES